MKQAVKKADVAKSVIDKNLSSETVRSSEKVKVQEATVLQLDRTKSLNRFLEASCDCV